MLKKATNFSDWLKSDYAHQYLQRESEFLKQALRHVAGPRVLQLGSAVDFELIEAVDFPLLLVADIDGSQKNHQQPSMCIDPAFTPIQADTLSTIVVPHVLERHSLPHQVLREAHRTLMPEGHIVLTGFNPRSALGLQRFLYPKAACPGRYLTVTRVSDWLQLLGFEIVASATFQYSPLINNRRIRKWFHFLNPVGDRWLPMLGGGYMITARKKIFGNTSVGKLSFAHAVPVKKRPRKLATATSSSKKVVRK